MALKRDYDEIEAMYKPNPDGESVTVINPLGKTACEAALEAGYRFCDRMPFFPFPTAVYRPNGDVKRIENRKDLEQALLPCTPTCRANCRVHNWERTVYAAPPLPPEPGFVVPAVAPGTPAASAGTVELALQLIASNTRAAEQDKVIAELQRQNAEILDLLKGKPQGKAGRPRNDD